MHDGQTLTSTGDPGGPTIPDRVVITEAGFLAAGILEAGSCVPDGTPATPGRIAAALTRTNATLGSPPYMSPEQWSDPLRVGPPSDLYALGVIAYQALTGRRPFSAATVAGFAELHRSGDVPPVGPGFPPALDELFRRALAKRVDDRPASALELAEALRTASGLGAPPSRLDRPARRSWLALGVGAALVAAVAATAAWMLGGSRDPMASPEASAHALPAPAPPAPPTAPAAAPDAAQVNASDAPATVPIHLESVPPRAEVFRLPSEIKVGATPWDGELQRSEGVAVFVVKKRGYLDQRIEVDLRSGARSRVRLSPVPATVHPSDDHDRHKGEPADPFKGRSR
jgi:hypothetical protein